MLAVGRQPIGEHASCRSRTDDDVVKFELIGTGCHFVIHCCYFAGSMPKKTDVRDENNFARLSVKQKSRPIDTDDRTAPRLSDALDSARLDKGEADGTT